MAKTAEKRKQAIEQRKLDEARQKVRRALAHDARVQAMVLFATPADPEKPEELPLVSPKEMAAVMKLPLPNVSYHTKILRELGVIELRKTTPRRGAVEHHYGLAKDMVPAVLEAVERYGSGKKVKAGEPCPYCGSTTGSFKR